MRKKSKELKQIENLIDQMDEKSLKLFLLKFIAERKELLNELLELLKKEKADNNISD